jgi:hypothetical protein
LFPPNLYLGDGFAHHLTIESGAQIDVYCSALNVYGNLVAPLGAPAIVDTECGYPVYLVGDGSIAGNTVVGNFETVWVQGNYRVSGADNQLIVSNELKVDGGNLAINGGRVDVGGIGGAGSGTFYTHNGGTLTMTNADDKLFVGSGGANFYGGSSLLAAGTLTLVNGHLYTMAPGTGTALDAFAPSGTHVTVFAGFSRVSFFDPALSFLRNAQILGGGTMFLDNNTLVTGTLSRGAGTGATSVATSAYPQPSWLLTVNGLNQSGANQMEFSNVMLRLTGTSGVTFGDAKFVGFGPGFIGSLFEVSRTGGPFTFSGLDFSLAGFGAGTSAHFINNSGAANITISGSTPPIGVNGTHYILGGTGTVGWP